MHLVVYALFQSVCTLIMARKQKQDTNQAKVLLIYDRSTSSFIKFSYSINNFNSLIGDFPFYR